MLKLLRFWTIFCRSVKNITKGSYAKNSTSRFWLLLSWTFMF